MGAAVPVPMLEILPETEQAGVSQEIRAYYQSRTVRDRIQEFLGSAVFVAGNDGSSEFAEPSPRSDLPRYLDAGLEVDRSLWDQKLLIAHVDLEYHNFDNPVAPWLEPERAFRLQQPVLDATLQILGASGIFPLTLLSGRGFHLAWAIEQGSSAFRRLADLGHVPASLQTRYAEPCSPEGLRVDSDQGRAFAGLGRVIEFLWHRVLTAAEARTAMSIQPAAIEVGPGTHGREIVSFDLSEYGDPLHARRIRIPFSAYLKPTRFDWLLANEQIRGLLPIFEIPLAGMDLTSAIAVARDPEASIELSRCTSTAIPDNSEAMNKLLDQYEGSALRRFHDRFYGELAGQALAAEDLGSIRVPQAPRCMQWLFENPNDWLLKPAALQHVVRVLMALNWSSLSIVQLIYAAYSKDCEWQDIWTRLEPCNRAIFYTRLFAGMIVTGADKLIDFNCVSYKEKGYCAVPDCRSNLITYRDMLQRRLN